MEVCVKPDGLTFFDGDGDVQVRDPISLEYIEVPSENPSLFAVQGKIMVRKEYTMLYDSLKENAKLRICAGTVVCGQSGIGALFSALSAVQSSAHTWIRKDHISILLPYSSSLRRPSHCLHHGFTISDLSFR